MHYHVLYVQLLFGLDDMVIENMSPTSILAAWDAGTIDAMGGWGTFYIACKNSDTGTVLVSAGVLECPRSICLFASNVECAGQLIEWGKTTFISFAVRRGFKEQYPAVV